MIKCLNFNQFLISFKNPNYQQSQKRTIVALSTSQSKRRERLIFIILMLPKQGIGSLSLPLPLIIENSIQSPGLI